MRAISMLILITAVLMVSGCGHQRAINDFGSNLYDATSDMTNTIDSMRSAEGVNVAYAKFNKDAPQLRQQWNKLITEKLTEQDKSDLVNAVMRSRQKMTDCFASHTEDFKSDKEFWLALGRARDRLEKDFSVEEMH